MIFLKVQLDGASWAIALFADDDFGHVGLFAIFIVVIIAVNEHDDVRILLDGAGFAEIGQHGALVLALFIGTAQLAETQDGDLQLLGHDLQHTADIGHRLLAVFAAVALAAGSITSASS